MPTKGDEPETLSSLTQPEVKHTYRLVGYCLFVLVIIFALFGLVVSFNEGAQKYFFGDYETSDSDVATITAISCLFLVGDCLMLVGVFMDSQHFFWPLIMLFYFVMFYWVVLVYVTLSANWLFCFFFVACICNAFLYGVCYTRQEIIRNKQEAELNS